MIQRAPGPVVVDSSVWIDHLRRSNATLAELIEDGSIRVHEFVIGELVLGTLPRGSTAAMDLAALPPATPASHDEVIAFLTEHRLQGSGIGWVDAHLLASAAISSARVWTLDKTLNRVAAKLGLGFETA